MELLVGIGADSKERPIEKCNNYGDVKATGEKTYMAVAGGMIGDGSCTMVITNCYNSGDIFVEKVSYGYAGGIAGRTQEQGTTRTLTMNNCYSKGKVSGEDITVNKVLGAIGGAVDILGVSDTYYYNKIDETPKALRNKDYEEEKVIGTDRDFNTFDDFIEWLNKNGL